MAEWERRPGPTVQGRPGARSSGDLSLSEARARARKLRNKREWEKP